jgi:NAD(P)-dependent dehydrogenase (short-subunit alcohol dehydrogenase family)
MGIKGSFKLNGKTALITGGSQGIGRAISLALAEYGSNIIIIYRSGKDLAEQTADEIRALGSTCHLKQSDISLAGSEKSILMFLTENSLEVDILVLNASVQVRKPWNEVTPEDFDLQIDTNLKASLFLIHCCPVKKITGRAIAD